MSEEEVLVVKITVAATAYKDGERSKGGKWHKYSFKGDDGEWYETFDNDVAWEGALPWNEISNGDELVLRYIVREKNNYVNNIIQEILDPETWNEKDEDQGPPEITSDDIAFGGSGKPQPKWGLEFEAPTGNPNKASKPTAQPAAESPAEKPAKPKKPAKAAKKPAKAAKPVEKDPVIDESAPPMARCMGEALDLLRAIQGSLPEEVKFSSDALLAATVQLTVALYEKES